MSRLGDRSIPMDGEESPSSVGQGCWITPSGGDSKESATEIDCLIRQVMVEM